ncbi:MAG: hypothetical protein WD512_02505 [Candidatus Paceibacterota bacterium]
MSLKEELDTASKFNRKYYGTYFVKLSKRNPEQVCWIRCRYPLGRSHHINCKENLTECGECHNQRCSHSMTKCMECEKSICNICAWTCELACKDQHLKGNMAELQSCSSCKNTKPNNSIANQKQNYSLSRTNNMPTSPPNNRFWWRKLTVNTHHNQDRGYTNNMLENIRKQYFDNINNRNNMNDSNNGSDKSSDKSLDKGSDKGSDDENENDNVNKIDNRAWWLKKPEKKWNSDYNSMIARQKANYQQTLLSNDHDDDDDSNNALGTSDDDEVDDGDNSSRSNNSDEGKPKLLYDWTDDDDDYEQMWGNH